MDMEYKMGLYEGPFNSIKSGMKTVEVRLNDQKRRNLRKGDTIEFTKLPEENEKVRVEIQALKRYSSFREMYEDIPAEQFDAVGREIEERVETIHKIYSSDLENKWGTLAIVMRLV
ncbi:ASCH domain-containing protein [Planococcus salinarum]|nr:ASCH domain-containing protein [Planococcus salinarum]